MIRIVMHGGAGAIFREQLNQEKEVAYRKVIKEALQAGYSVLAAGGTAVAAVVAAVRIMEDNPLYNAGRGSVLTHDGRIEMDAALMDGKTLSAGAIASVTCIKNPISAAYTVMTNSPHLMLIGSGAEAFAREQGLELADLSYFRTNERFEQWRAIVHTDRAVLDHTAAKIIDEEKHLGTVGAVALDMNGNLASATSTGGMSNKRYGRVGDTPIIGAGTYANNATCAISATGHGEYFIRTVCAHTISALMEYRGLSLQEASESMLKTIKDMGGEGGLIGIDRMGNITLPYNTAGMYRGWSDEQGNLHTAIFENE